MDLYKGFLCHPTVCAVGENYQIIVPVKYNMLFSVIVGDKEYYNHSNGIRLTTTKLQRVNIPMAELDREKEYTVVCRKMIQRKPYFSITAKKEDRIKYTFRPIEKNDNIKIYQVADSHGCVEQAVKACCNYSEEIDLFVLNGDVANASETFDEIITCYKIASRVTEGTIPCVISRGNHDLRGKYAEVLVDHMPNRYGNSYYTFKIGCIWGILLDCGEDKTDDHEEYGRSICCHSYRKEVTEYLKDIIKSKEYESDEIKYKLVLSHVPFAYKIYPPFDIEEEIYTEWCKLLKENVKPDLMLSGHLHTLAVSDYGSEYDTYGQPCKVIIGSDLSDGKKNEREYTGAGVLLNKKQALVEFTSNKGYSEKHEIKL